MPRFTRRTLAASALAVTSLELITAGAQEASPVSDFPSGHTLEVLLTDVISQGNLRLIPDLIDSSTAKADEFFLTMVEMATGIRGEEEGVIPLTRKMAHVEVDRAIVLVDLGEAPDSFAFLYLEFIPETGLIREVNAAWHNY